MNKLLRAYELYIGESTKLSEKVSQPDANKSDGKVPSQDVRTIPERGKYILIQGNELSQGYQIEADIAFPKEGRGDKNPTQTIKVYNPPADFERYIKKDNTVILKAGYTRDEFLPIICATQIVRSYIKKSGNNRIATIICSEAYAVRRDVVYNTTLNKSLTYSQAIDQILSVFNSYGVPVGKVQYSEKAKQTQLGRPKPVSGSLEKTLNSLCSNINLRWYIAAGELFITPLGNEKDDFIGVLKVKPENVKNTIEFLDDDSNKNNSETVTQTKGIRFSINLEGNINKSDGVDITNSLVGESQTFRQYEGQYLITSVTHRLSYEGQNWDTIIEARSV